MAETPAEFINGMGPTEAFGMEITAAADGRATGRLDRQEAFCFETEAGPVLHGAVVFALADNVGAAAGMSRYPEPEPAYTVDLRIDYLDAARSDISAEADLLRYGRVASVADIVVEDADSEAVAVARGSYRTI